MLAKVIDTTTVHNIARKVGDIVEVDENTFRNLSKKGRLEVAPQGAKETNPVDSAHEKSKGK